MPHTPNIHTPGHSPAILRLLRPILAVFLLSVVLVLPVTVAAQSLTTQNNATIEIDSEFDAAGDLATSAGGEFAFASGAALTLSGSTEQDIAPGSITVADLTLDNSNGAVLNSTVDVSEILTLMSGPLTTNGNLTLTSTGESSSARISGSGSGTISGDVTAERYVERDDGNADDSHWRFLASPVDTPLDTEPGGGGGEHDPYDGPALLSNTWTQGDGMTGANAQGSGADPSVFFYDETATVGSDLTQGWAPVGDLTNPSGEGGIESQEGFAIFLFQDRDSDGTDEGFPITLSATGTVSATENDGTDVTLPVECTDNDGGDPGNDGCTDDFDGWNLVANPFLSHFDWTSDAVTKQELQANAYIYDADADQYQQTDGTNGGDEFIAPFQAFFVKSDAADGAESNVDLKVNSGAKADPSSAGDRELKSIDPEPVVSLQLNDGSQAEETRITYRDGAKAEKDRYDGYQLTPLSGDYHFLATEMAGREALFDSQYRPPPVEEDTIDLAIEATESGTFTLEVDTLKNLPSDWQVIMENKESGNRWDFGAGEAITFDYTVPETTAKLSTRNVRTALTEGQPAVTQSDSGGSGAPDLRLFVGPEAALPVELTGFDAGVQGSADGTAVTLSWQTASETNNASFVVERRSEGKTWTQVGYREGAGTTDQTQTYRFIDEQVPFEAEQVRYRLRQTDLDGTTTLSDEISVDLPAPTEARLHAPFPNPARSHATVRYEVPEETSVKIALFDALGRRVRSVVHRQEDAGRAERILDVSGLPSGTYFLRMQAGSVAETRRISVVR